MLQGPPSAMLCCLFQTTGQEKWALLMKFWQENNANGTDEKEMGWGWGVRLPRTHSKSKKRESVGKEAGRSHVEEAAGEGRGEGGGAEMLWEASAWPGLAHGLGGRAPKAQA